MPKHAKKPHEHAGPGKGRDPEVLGGVIVQFNFSPRGGVEGHAAPGGGPDRAGQRPAGCVARHGPCDRDWAGDAGRRRAGAGIPPGTARASTPVYRLLWFNPSEEPGEDGPVSVAGVVARFNYARHGEANGVVLEDGDFIHLKPGGMKKLGLHVGQHIAAKGTACTC